MKLVKVNEYRSCISQGELNLIINKTRELSSITNDIYLKGFSVIKAELIPKTIAYNVSEKR